MRLDDEARRLRYNERLEVISQVNVAALMSGYGKRVCPTTHGRRVPTPSGPRRTYCNSWRCVVCSAINARLVEILIQAGLFYATTIGLVSWHVVFTPPGAMNWTTSDYLSRIRRRSVLKACLHSSVLVVEAFESGEPHLHGVVIAPTMRGRSFRRVVCDAGLGWPKIRPVQPGIRDATTVSSYVTKNLARIVMTHPSLFGPKAEPARFTRSWPAGGLSDGRKIVSELIRIRRELAFKGRRDGSWC